MTNADTCEHGVSGAIGCAHCAGEGYVFCYNDNALAPRDYAGVAVVGGPVFGGDLDSDTVAVGPSEPERLLIAYVTKTADLETRVRARRYLIARGLIREDGAK